MRGLILRRKTGTVSVEVFTFHVHLAFERHPETELVHQLRGLRGSLTGNKRNLYNLNLLLLRIIKMYDSKDRTVAFTSKIEF